MCVGTLFCVGLILVRMGYRDNNRARQSLKFPSLVQRVGGVANQHAATLKEHLKTGLGYKIFSA